jgi:hypothetical protein
VKNLSIFNANARKNKNYGEREGEREREYQEILLNAFSSVMKEQNICFFEPCVSCRHA